MPKQLFVVQDFRGGWNADAADDALLDNELRVADNVDLSERGGLTKRKGTRRLNRVDYTGDVVRLFEWKKPDGTTQLLAITREVNGPTLGRIRDDQDWRFEGIALLESEDAAVLGFKDKLLFLDGSNLYEYDGSNWGPIAPEDHPENDMTAVRRCNLLVWHPKSQRFFAAGDPKDVQAIYFSEPGAPNFWKGTSVLHPTSGEGAIQAISLFGDAVLVWYEDSLWLWRGIDPDVDASWERLPIGLGKIAKRTITLTPDSLAVLARGGLYALAAPAVGYTTVAEPGRSMVANLAQNKVQSVIKSMRLDLATALYDPTEERLMVAYSDNPALGYNDQILVFDWGLGGFTRYTGIRVDDWCLRRGTGQIVVASGRKLLEFGVGYDDDGEPYEARIATKFFNCGYPFYKKRFFRLYMAFRQSTEVDAFQLSSSIVVDYTTEFKVEKAIPYDGFRWGDPWGKPWGSRDYMATRSKISASGHRVQFRFWNDQPGVPMTFYGAAIEFRPIRAKGERLA